MGAADQGQKPAQTILGRWSATGEGLLPLWRQLKSPVLWLVGALALYQPRDVVGFLFPFTVLGAAACAVAIGGWIWFGMRGRPRWFIDLALVFFLFLVGAVQFGVLLRSKEVTYILPISQSPILAAVGPTEYAFFGRNVRLLPVPDRLKQRWAAMFAQSSDTTIYLQESVDARETIYGHPAETALAQANDPSKDLLWKVIEIPRLVRTRAGVIDVSTRPVVMWINPEGLLKPLKLWSPGHDFRSGLFATRQGNLGVAELAHRIVFQFELFSALGARPVDQIVAAIDQEARRQGSDEMMAQALAVRLLLITDLADGDFYAPDLILELKRAVRLAQDRDWSSRHAWFPTLLVAMQEADAKLTRSGAASMGTLGGPTLSRDGGTSPFSAAIVQLQPAWLKADVAANEERARKAMQFLADEQLRKPSTPFEQIDALLRARAENEYGDPRFARSLWLLPPGQFEEGVNAWLIKDESKRLYRLLVLRNLGEERIGLMFSRLLASRQIAPESLAETRTILAEIESKQETLASLLPAGISALYAKDANWAAVIDSYEGMVDLGFCLLSFLEPQCASLATSTTLEMIRFSVGQKGSTFEYMLRARMEGRFDQDLLMRSLIRDLRVPAPRHSLASIDRLFAIYQLRVMREEDADIAGDTLFEEACMSAADLSNKMLNDDEFLAEASTHLAFLALEGVCGGIDVQSHRRLLEDLMAD